MALAHDLCAGERLEAAHRPRPPFQMLMVALDALLRELARDVLDLRQDHGECGRIDRRSIRCRQSGRHMSALNRPRQERCGCGSVARWANIDINNLAFLVDRAQRITPPAGNPDLCLIDTPPLPDTTATRARGFLIERSELLDPIEDS